MIRNLKQFIRKFSYQGIQPNPKTKYTAGAVRHTNPLEGRASQSHKQTNIPPDRLAQLDSLVLDQEVAKELRLCPSKWPMCMIGKSSQELI